MHNGGLNTFLAIAGVVLSVASLTGELGWAVDQRMSTALVALAVIGALGGMNDSQSENI